MIEDIVNNSIDKPTAKSLYISVFSAFMLSKITSLASNFTGSEVKQDELSGFIEPITNFLNFFYIDKIKPIPFLDLNTGFGGTAHIVNYLLTYVPIFFILLNFKYSVNKVEVFINNNEKLKVFFSNIIEPIKETYNDLFKKDTINKNEINLIFANINGEEHSYTFNKDLLLSVTPELKIEIINFGIHSGKLWFELPLAYLDWGFDKFEGHDQEILCTCLNYHNEIGTLN